MYFSRRAHQEISLDHRVCPESDIISSLLRTAPNAWIGLGDPCPGPYPLPRTGTCRHSSPASTPPPLPPPATSSSSCSTGPRPGNALQPPHQIRHPSHFRRQCCPQFPFPAPCSANAPLGRPPCSCLRSSGCVYEREKEVGQYGRVPLTRRRSPHTHPSLSRSLSRLLSRYLELDLEVDRSLRGRRCLSLDRDRSRRL